MLVLPFRPMTPWIVTAILGCATILFPRPAMAEAESAAAAEAEQFDYRETVLENGLRVISLEDFSCPIVAVNLWYHVGSKDEDPRRQGFAHMFEHMMFRGTDRLGSTDHFDLIRRTGGTCNAYTTFDQTVYTQTLPANQLNLALWLEAERMSMLKIDQEAFDTERKVVEEERRMGLSKPYGRLLEKVLPEVFPEHPYRWSTIGSIPHLRSASVAELREFWNTYYVPNNATLVVVGAVKHGEVLQLAKRNFGWIPRGDDPVRIERPAREAFEAREVTITEKNAPAPIAGLVFRGVPLNHPDRMAVDLMTTILGGGESSRLYRRIVAEEQSAVMAMGGQLNLEQDGLIGAAAVMTPIGGDPDAAIASIREEIERMRGEPVTDAELEKARNQMLAGLVTESLTVDSKAAALGSAAVLEGDVSRVNTRIDRIRAVTAGDIQRVARQYLDPDQAITGRVKSNLLGTLGSLLGMKDDIEDAPITAEAETDPPPPGRPGVVRPADRLAKSPIAGPLSYVADTEFDELTLDNGLKIIVVENREVPFVSVRLGLEAGAWTESQPGAASMALGMLTKGTQSRTEKEIAEELETYAISLSGSAGMDSASVVLGGLPEQIERGMRLMADVVMNNTMPAEEFAKLKKQTVTGLSISEQEPAAIAGREMNRRLYGDHPYARPAGGSSEDVKALTREEVRRWWKTFARPDMATLIFAGDIDLATAGTLAKETLIGWRAEGPKPEVVLPDLPDVTSTQIFLVNKPGVQSEIRVGHRSMTRDDSDYFPSRIVSGYFGGGFNSRLNETIRVQKGLTYGARGGFSAKKRSGEFMISTFSKNATAVEAVAAILDEVEKLKTVAPTEDELTNTISYFIGSYPSTRETSQQVAGELWSQRVLGLPDDYTERLLTSVARTTAEDCLRVARDHVRPDELTIVVVGPAGRLKNALESIAPVTVVDPNRE